MMLSGKPYKDGYEWGMLGDALVQREGEIVEEYVFDITSLNIV